MKKKNLILTVGLVFVLVIAVVGISYAFFNYNRTGSENILQVGNISFNSSQNPATLTLSNVFPIDRSTVNDSGNTNVASVSIDVSGNTTYSGGVEYLLTTDNVSVTTGSKKVPISLVVTVSGKDSKTLGTENVSYLENRGGTTSIYKVLTNGNLKEDGQILEGFIAPSTSSQDNSVSGTITIKAFIDQDKILISDTYPEGSTTINGVTYYNGTPLTDKVVLTTSEWNSFRTNGISFQVKVEAREGVWVEEEQTLADVVISRLGQDGVVAINTSGALASGSDTIREYRYSGGGRYCEYENNGTTYKFQIEENTCPETVVFGGSPTGLYSPTSDIAAYQGGNAPSGTTYTLKTGTGVQEGTVKNYISFNGEMWRIIGVFDGKVKIMKDLPIKTDDSYVVNNYTALNNTSYSIKPNFGTSPMANAKYAPIQWNSQNKNDRATAGLQYWLNENNTGSYYNTISSTYKNLIADETYYLSNVNTISWGTASSVYNDERATAVECASSVTSNSRSNSCNVWNGNSATWDGKIALPYPSDFGYAANSSYYGTSIGSYWNASDPTIQGENWFLNNDAYYNWSLSPSSSNSETVAYWYGPGYVNYGAIAGNIDAVRPVLNLESQVILGGGNGTYSSPYTLKVN